MSPNILLVLKALGGFSVVAAGLLGFAKVLYWNSQSTQEGDKEKIDSKVDNEQQNTEDTGRPE